MYTQQLGHIVVGLLRRHPLVILPGFGGLVLERIPASLDPQRGRLVPPSDTLHFNARLHHNDGLLAEAVAARWGFSLAEADLWLTDAISELRFELSGGGRVDWPQLGTFSTSVEGRVHFTPASDRSVSDDLFGLRPLQVKEVVRETTLRERTLEAAKELPAKRIIGYAVAAMAVGLLAWLPFQEGVVDGGRHLVAEMGLMPVQGTASYQPREFRPLWEPEIGMGTEAPEAAVLIADIPEETSSDVIVNYPTRFHVVAATFATLTEAEAHRDRLVSRGFGAEMAGMDNGRFAVAYGTYDGLDGAEAMLASVRLSNTEAHIIPAN